MYDYGWRNYMPDIGRWTQIDPLFNDLKFAHDNLDVDPDDEDEVYLAIINDAEVGGGIYNTENLNPYGYGYNNPVSFDDPDGRCPSCDNDPIGSLLSWTDVDDIAVAVTTVTRGVLGMYDDKPKHIDGTDADGGDYGFLIAGAILPVVSGGTLKKLIKGADKLLDGAKKAEKKAPSREQVTKVFSTRKKALDARPKPSPAKKGGKQVTRQSRNKVGEGKKMKTDGGSQTPHVHDKNHSNKNKPNVHYRVGTKKIKPN